MPRIYCPEPLTVEERANQAPRIRGYAAVFYRQDDPDTEYALWDDLTERLDPDVFNRALQEKDDAVAVYNHDQSQPPLGRVSSGTLELTTDARGLAYSITPPDTAYARAVIAAIARRDITGSSFAFEVRDAELLEQDGRQIRLLKDVQLYDVGPVAHPAYAGTTTQLRAHRRELIDWIAERRRIRAKIEELRQWIPTNTNS